MTARHALSLFALVTLAVAGCGDPPPVPTEDGGPPVDSGPPGCGPGTTLCGDVCADLDDSRAHCGACDEACAAGEACIEGACDVVCPTGQVECSGACVATDTDRLHCGSCGVACESGEACVDGSCATSCPAGQTLCGTACVDTTSHPGNCGACGTTCDAGEVCSTGTCQASCGGGLTECDGACASTDSDPSNCGACGTVCPGAAGAVGACVAGTCVTACEPLAGDCNADRTSPTGDGCETPLATDAENCGACGRVCAVANAVAGCAAGSCVVATCDAGFTDCDGSAANGCEIATATDEANCGTCGMVCGTGTECVQGACVTPVGEDCSDAVALTLGPNTVPWSATTSNYFSTISCQDDWPLVGPDVVMSFTAPATPATALYTLRFSKPAGTRWGATVSTAACGTLTPELACISEFGPMDGSFVLDANATAHIYVRDTTSGVLPLSNPLSIEVVQTDCASPPPIRVDPANGATAPRRAATFTVTSQAPINPNAGVITLTGNMGTTLSYDLAAATRPPEVTFDATSKIMTITPLTIFAPGEVITVSWTGLQARTCTAFVPLPAPTWQVTAPVPPCGGTTAANVTRHPTDLTLTSEWFIHADESPTGFVYVGGTSNLYRIPKAGGPSQDIEALAGLTTDQLGYAMAIVGPNIFTIESRSGGSIGHVYRISSDGGATWSVEDYARFPVAPSEDLHGAVVYGGRIYLITHVASDTSRTEIWSIDGTATTLPVTPTLEVSFTGEESCSGLTRDASFYYAGCTTGERLIRIPVGGGAPQLITTFFDMNSNATALHGVDGNADGVFDELYVQTWTEAAGYVCGPTTGSVYVDLFTRFGGDTGSFGMGFDRTANTFWLYDDDSHELISVQR